MNLIQKIYLKIRSIFATIDRYIMGNRDLQPAQSFRYQKPGPEDRGSKEVIMLGNVPTLRAAVHVIREDSADNLHSHSTIDGFWYVLSGKARFHGEDGTIRGEFGPGEGILVPRNTRYWYESAAEEDLELLQVLAIDRTEGWRRKNHEPKKYDRKTAKYFDGRITPADS